MKKRILVSVFLLGLAVVLLGASNIAKATISDDRLIKESVEVGDNSVILSWNVSQKYDKCTVEYGENQANMLVVNGNLIQAPTSTNDGRYYYSVNITNLKSHTEYSYDITCNGNSGGSSAISNFTTGEKKQVIEGINSSETIESSNSATVYWNLTRKFDNCIIDYTDNILESSNYGSNSYSGNLISYTNGKYYYSAKLTNLKPSTEYQYSITCSTINSEEYKMESTTGSFTTNKGTITNDVINSTANVNGTSVEISSNLKTKFDACTASYSENYDLSGGIATNGNLVQTPTSTNDGKYYYSFKPGNLKLNTKYYYKVTCSNANNSSSLTSSIFNFITIKNPNIEEPKDDIRSNVNINNNNAVIYFNLSSKFDACNIDYSENENLSLGTGTNGNLIQTPSATNDGRYYYAVNLNNLKSNTKYYYGVICNNRNSNSSTRSKTFNFVTNAASNTITTTPKPNTEITDIANKSKQLANNDMSQILAELKELRNIVKEQQNEIKYLKSLKNEMAVLSENMKSAINNFITYGVDANTKKLGEGERAAVINSYKEAFDKLPQTEAEMSDAIKIANGRWPSQTSATAEKEAKAQFEKIYKKIPDMNNAKDNAAVTIMAYGLKQKAENRNLNSEKAGIDIFKKLYGKAPSTTQEWNMVGAITYSGSAREKDSDNDLIPDEREKTLGTDPNKKDSDGDGYSDGEEVKNGYSPLGQ